MLICYDLKHSPPTYDFVACLLWAEMERIAAGEDTVEIVITPGPNDGFRHDNLWPQSSEVRRALLDRIVLPMARLLPNCSAKVLDHRDIEGANGFGRPGHGIRLLAKAFKQGIRPLRAQPLSTKPYVTITLREAEHHRSRNSDITAWLNAAREIDMDVVVIPDTARPHADTGGITFDNQASIDLDRRAALYAGATLNMGVSNGPMAVSLAMDRPTVVFRMIAEGAPCCSAEFFRNVAGWEPGDPHPWGARHQTLVWGQDTTEAILAAYQATERSPHDHQP